MRTNLSRQNVYILTASLFLLLFVTVFSFAILIPQGKEYRVKRAELKKESLELEQLNDFFSKKSQILSKLQSDNLHVITAFDKSFNADRFKKLYKSYFTSLEISKVNRLEDEDGFNVYEVNTTSKISSPQNFYDFLDSINKSDWIIGVNFPIEFKRDGEKIKSSFTMRVYSNAKDSNSSALKPK